MKRLHLLMLRSYIGPMLITFFITLFILLMQFFWKYVDELVGKGIGWETLLELMLYISATLVPMALPLSILLSALMTYGNLGENSELMAIKAAGISLQRAMRPLMALTALISIGAFFFANRVMPSANLQAYKLLHEVTQQKPELVIRPGIFNTDIDGYAVKAEKTDKKKGLFYQVMLYDHTSNAQHPDITLADSARFQISEKKDYMVVTLYHGATYEDVRQKNRISRTFPHRKDLFEEKQILVELTGFSMKKADASLFKNHFQMLNLKQLDIAIDSIDLAMRSRQNELTDNLVKSKLMRNSMNDRTMARILADSIEPTFNESLPVHLDIDSLYESLDQMRKERVLDLALNEARNMKQIEISFTRDNLDATLRWKRRHQIEWHRKFTLSIACLIFFFIGAPLGAIIRKGGFGMPVVVSVLFFLFYYIMTLSGDKFARESLLRPWLGMWLASLILLPIGVFFTYKATTDSTLMSRDAYTRIIKRFVGLFRRKKPQTDIPQTSNEHPDSGQ